MRICILSPEDSPSLGGVGAYTYNLARELCNVHDVHIISINRESSEQLHELLQGECTVRYVTRTHRADGFLYNAKLQVKLARFLPHYCRDNSIDLVHSHSGHLPHLLSQLNTDLPHIVTVHATVRGLKRGIRLSEPGNTTEELTTILSPAIEFGELLSFHMSNKLLPVSSFTLKELLERYGKRFAGKAKVVLNAVDPQVFRPILRPPEREIRLLHVGRFNAIKGLRMFVTAVQRLSRTAPNIVPVVVASDSREACWSGEIIRMGGKVLPRRSYTEMPSLYNEVSALVITSNYENCPNVMLEAMACGRPVIAPRIGGIPEVVRHGVSGYLYPPGDLEGLCRILAELSTHPEIAARMGAEARRTILDRFDWRGGIHVITKIYEEALNEGIAS